MVSSRRGAFSRALRAARLEVEALVRAVAVKAEAVLVVDLVRVPGLEPELVEVAVLVADRVVVLLQWLPAR
jgi:hypothetical protein